MKNILLLFTKYAVDTGQSDPAALCNALTEAAKGAAHYEYALYDDLQHYINADDAYICTPDGRRLDTYDAIYQRRWSTMPVHAVAVAVYLKKQGVPCIDDESDHAGSTNKLVQYWRMWQHDLPFPRTVFVSPSHLSDWLKSQLTNEFTLPCIMKSIASQRGQNNYLVRSVEEAVRIATDNPTVPFVVQECIPNNGDYRVLVCGDRVGLVIYRKGTDSSHTNNTSQGATATIVPAADLPDATREACVKAAQVFGRNIAGVDVVVHKNKPDLFYFFEVNRSPQIDHSSFTNEKAAVLHEYFMAIAGGKA
jgi:glutathione synthase/RimK-type ligase-like ATP-grasp enzyme